MTLAAIKRTLLFALAALLIAPHCASAQSAVDRGGPVFFAGLVGQGSSPRAKVLLRWYSVDDVILFQTFSVYRKPGGTASTNPFVKITETQKLRNVSLIRSIFERPGEDEIYADILDQLQATSDGVVDPSNYVYRLLEILDGGGDCDSCGPRAKLLTHSNYGVAIVEGLGYLDRVASGTYTYELRTGAAPGADDIIIGRITIDASAATKLPAPLKPEEVEIGGIRGDRKVFLQWDRSADLMKSVPLNFGFNVYRLNRHLNSGDTFDLLYNAGSLEKINRLPLVLNNATSGDRSADEQYDFVDDNLSFDKAGRLGTPFTVGDELTYWVAVRDLLGQNGDASDPIEITVEDRKAPTVPKGLTTIEDRVDSSRRITLEWNSNHDGDTVAYEIFRYKYYHHVGRIGAPFEDDAELTYTVTEGLVTAVPEAAAFKTNYRDGDIVLPDDEGRAYWYCVRALDAAGNASGLSQPARGVLFDREAPAPPTSIKICTTRYECDVQFQKIGETPNAKQGTIVGFNLDSKSDAITAVRLVRVERERRKILYSGRVVAGETVSVSDVFREHNEGVSDDITYEIWARTKLGDWCGPHELPAPFMTQLIQTGDANVDYRVVIDAVPALICEDGLEPGRVPHDPRANVGESNVEVVVTLSGDDVGAVLYRAEDCTDFRRVTEARDESGVSSVTLVDDLRPGSTSIICYGVRTYDENHNLSGMTYLESHVAFAGTESVEPMIETITALGSFTAPELRIRWFGAYDGAAGYQIEAVTGLIAKANAFSGTSFSGLTENDPVSTVYPVDDLSYDDSTGLWSLRITSLDHNGAVPLKTNIAYRFRVDAVDVLGNATEGGNTKRFVWSDQPDIAETLDWPLRVFPDEGAALPAFNNIPDSDFVQRGLAVQISDPDHSVNDEVNPLEILVVDTPFIVYRRRVDLPNQPYIQIGPLIEKINTDSSGEALDPFIRDYSVKAFYMDYVGLVKNAAYQYVVVELDESGELETIHSPTSPVKVNFD
ncbi:MAG: hypothetical protein P9L94_15380 [Candidatus Hinthialibacter antarcticus]|nr:hypothetical protein [Candidatus Hinthialibacter antarcticus]